MKLLVTILLIFGAIGVIVGLVIFLIVKHKSNDNGGGNKNCIPNCVGKECGDDGCKGTCGRCPANSQCVGSKCCAGCDDHSCLCPTGELCVDGTCCIKPTDPSFCGTYCGVTKACPSGYNCTLDSGEKYGKCTIQCSSHGKPDPTGTSCICDDSYWGDTCNNYKLCYNGQPDQKTGNCVCDSSHKGVDCRQSIACPILSLKVPSNYLPTGYYNIFWNPYLNPPGIITYQFLGIYMEDATGGPLVACTTDCSKSDPKYVFPRWYYNADNKTLSGWVGDKLYYMQANDKCLNVDCIGQTTNCNKNKIPPVPYTSQNINQGTEVIIPGVINNYNPLTYRGSLYSVQAGAMASIRGGLSPECVNNSSPCGCRCGHANETGCEGTGFTLIWTDSTSQTPMNWLFIPV